MANNKWYTWVSHWFHWGDFTLTYRSYFTSFITGRGGPTFFSGGTRKQHPAWIIVFLSDGLIKPWTLPKWTPLVGKKKRSFFFGKTFLVLVGGFNQPQLKNITVVKNEFIFPNFQGWKYKNLWNHHPVLKGCSTLGCSPMAPREKADLPTSLGSHTVLSPWAASFGRGWESISMNNWSSAF